MRKRNVIVVGVVCFGLGIGGAQIFRSLPIGGGETASMRAGGGETRLSGMAGDDGSEGGGGESNPDGAADVNPAGIPSVAELMGLVDRLDDEGSALKLRQRLLGIGTGDLESLLAQVQRDGVGSGSYTALRAIGKRLAEADPARAFDFAADPENLQLSGWVLSSAVKELTKTSPQEVVEKVFALKSLHMRGQASYHMLYTTASVHPEMIGTLIQDKRVRSELFKNGWQMRKVFEPWAAHDPEAAATFAEQMPSGQARRYSLEKVAEIFAQTDPARAVAWAQGMKDRALGRDAIGSIVGQMVSKDPEGAFRLLAESRQQDRRDLIRSIAGHLGSDDPERAVEWIGTLEDPQEKSAAIERLGGEVAQLGSEGVERLMAQLPEKLRKNAGEKLISNWLYHDTDAAIAWAKSADDPKVREAYLKEAADHLAWSDPEKSLELLGGMGELTPEFRRSLGYAFSNLANRDLDAAREVLETLEDGEAKEKARESILNAWAKDDPESAATSVLAKTSDTAVQRRQIRTIAYEWAGRDVEAALGWSEGQSDELRVASADSIINQMVADGALDRARETLSQLIEELPEETSKPKRLAYSLGTVLEKVGADDPQAGIELVNGLTTERAQKEAVGALIKGWAGDDLADAQDWVGQLGDGPVRDAAIVPMVNQLSSKDAPAAFGLALTVGGEEEREKALPRAIRVWFDEDPGAAREAFEAADLSDAEREKLRVHVE